MTTSVIRGGGLVGAVCLVVVVALLCAGCPTKVTPVTPTPPSGIPQGEPIKIGAILSVTGAAGAPLGTPEKNTAQMVVDLINQNGGLKGRPVTLIVEDDQSDSTLAATAAKKLIESDKVCAVIGPSLSGTTLAIVDTFEKAQIPLISCAASVKITQPVKKWVFSTAQPDVIAVAKLFAFMKTKNLKKIGVIYDSNPFGKSGLEALTKQAAGAGMTIVGSESFESKDTDMTTQLTKIKGASPDAIVCWGTNPGPAIVAKNVKTLKLTMPLFMSHGVSNQKFIELAGPAADGVIFPSGRILVASLLPETDKQKPVLGEFAKAYTDKYKLPPDHFGGHAWDAMRLLQKVIQENGAEPAKIREGLEGVKNFIGISGVFSLSPTDHNGLTQDAFVMVTVKQGKWALAE
jgi:branched-chain amino acid transport system substrate-binding protein